MHFPFLIFPPALSFFTSSIHTLKIMVTSSSSFWSMQFFSTDVIPVFDLLCLNSLWYLEIGFIELEIEKGLFDRRRSDGISSWD